MNDTNFQTVKKNNKGENVVDVGSGYLSPIEYIDDLINQLKGDIFPLFEVSGYAPFTIARNTFCFIDHVSSLKYGTINQTGRIKRIISEFASFDSYIQGKYKLYADYIVQVYRHDIVHNVRPFPHKIKVVEKNGSKQDKISWFAVSSDIGNSLPKPETFEKLTVHFKVTKNRKGLCHLRYYGDNVVINNYCLFFDLVNFLLEYKHNLESDSNLQNEFVNNYQNIVEHYFEIKNFTLDKSKDKECKLI